MALRAILVFIAVSFVCLVHGTASEPPVVTIKHGTVRGHAIERNNLTIFAFEGIPYARPPVGERRFQAPEEVGPWEGELNATTPGAQCVQFNFFVNSTLGEENCLFLNVFTISSPQSWETTKIPVMVWIHGGGFIAGSGDFDQMHPDSILKEGLLIVSINYRLGVLGFLNTEDSAAPGNAGLKDMVLALRWVKENIGAFGGDVEQVSIAGISAGGAAVHYLTISPMASGLFVRAAALSGSALNPWAFQENRREAAQRLGARFGCTDPQTLVTCLQSQDAIALVTTRPVEQENNFIFWKGAFVPSVEAPGSSSTPFLSSRPEDLMWTNSTPAVPYLSGITDSEGIMFYKVGLSNVNDSSEWVTVSNTFDELYTEDLPYGLRTRENMQRVKEFYLGNRNISDVPNDGETQRRFVQMMSDILFSEGAERSVLAAASRGAHAYMYEFTYSSPTMTFVKHFYNAAHVPGVAHGDDLPFLFDVVMTRLHPSEVDTAVKTRHIALITNFLKTGNPTPEGSSLPPWPQFTPASREYADMNANIIYKEHALGERPPFWRQLLSSSGHLCQESISEHQEKKEGAPIVKIEQGFLRGRHLESEGGGYFFSFQGIPYAKPPLNEQRFKDPQLPEAWEGMRDAHQEGNSCLQVDRLGRRGLIGDEDCLYLNVYSPRLPSTGDELLPVMVWIHGGGFVIGSGNSDTYGPDFLVGDGVLLVTFNYRLGALGFLSLGKDAPGNVGLKDQVAALRWVQRNIAAFGGDPKKVTIFGESAGGASVHLHMLSPMSKGLFQAAIAQSGSAINPWAMQVTPQKNGNLLAQVVGCTTENDSATVKCLRNVDAKSLVEAAPKAFLLQDAGPIVKFHFVPTVDHPVEGVESFLPAPPQQLIQQQRHHQVPFLTGLNEKESYIHLMFIDFLTSEEKARTIDDNWEKIILPDIQPPVNDSTSTAALDAIRLFYMKGKPLTNETMEGFLDFLTDLSFGAGMYFSLQNMLLTKNSPVYLYHFIIDDSLNFLSRLTHLGLPGACHADDIGYLFHVKFLPKVSTNSLAYMERARMVRMWTNFAKFGNPTPNNDPLISTKWNTYDDTERNYLEIGAELRQRDNLHKDRVNFWDNFYKMYATK